MQGIHAWVGNGLMVMALGSMLRAAGWPQWRGPERNGIAPASQERAKVKGDDLLTGAAAAAP